jgi:hypothetical protein
MYRYIQCDGSVPMYDMLNPRQENGRERKVNALLAYIIIKMPYT